MQRCEISSLQLFSKPVWKPKLKKPWFQLAKEAWLG